MSIRVCLTAHEDSHNISEAMTPIARYDHRGALKRELVACLRTGRALRIPRERARHSGKKFVTNEVKLSQLGLPRDDGHSNIGDHGSSKATVFKVKELGGE